jgi:hypothetical protein
MAKQTFTTGQVLTAAQMTSLQQTAMLGGAASAKTASYTLVAADAGTAISMSNASATTITVNTALFAAGDTVQITNLGVGVCTITAGTATVDTSASLALAQYESGTLDFTSTSAAIFIKGAGAAAASGGMTLISTTSLSGASVTLSSIPATYNNLQVVIFGVTNATADGYLRIAPNGATSSCNNQFLKGGDDLVEKQTGTYITLTSPSGGNLLVRANANNTFVLNIFNYASSTAYKSYQSNGFGRINATDNLGATILNGVYFANTAISSLVISNSGGNLSTGTCLLYGVK